VASSDEKKTRKTKGAISAIRDEILVAGIPEFLQLQLSSLQIELNVK
jgi:hypothetical protein